MDLGTARFVVIEVAPGEHVDALDPGLRRTGWGVVTVEGTRLSFVACGTVTSPDKASLAERLVALHDGLDAVIAANRPDEAAVEETFVNKDAAATLKLGQARGIA
ncbi:MAG TPA: crossover junction endodeoxyribonuclease RuvC, partial [Microthrixaceae bacterium]|nr:crossover junction endodeoxyribonuclease RuvC [Microthrixaceae bacterium]